VASRSDPKDGLLVPVIASLAVDVFTGAQGGTLPIGANTAQPRPGFSEPQQSGSKLVPRIHNAQHYDARIQVVEAGVPGRGTGPEIAYRTDTDGEEDDPDYRGWNTPNWITGWNAPYYSTTGSTVFDAVVDPSTQQVFLFHGEGAKGHRGNPLDLSWTDLTMPSSVSPGPYSFAAVVIPESGRILAFEQSALVWSGHYTDDLGATWVEFTRRPPDGMAASNTKASLEYLNGDLVWISRKGAASADLYQAMSADLGSSWSEVTTATTICATSAWAAPSTCVVPGRVLVAYIRNADSHPVIRVLGSASEVLSSAPEVVINAGAASEVEICADPDGYVWAFVREDGARSEEIDVYVSYDLGDTWTALDIGCYHSSASNDWITNFRAVATCGMICLLHNNSATTASYDGSIGALWLGGWGTVVSGLDRGTRLTDPVVQRFTGFGLDSVNSNASAVWIPIEKPEHNGWTHAATAGTTALQSPGELNISTTAALEYYTRALGTGLDIVALIQVSKVSGGSVSTNAIACKINVANGASDFEVVLQIGAGQMAIFDTNAAAYVATWTIDTTVDQQVLIEIDGLAAKVNVWTRRPGGTIWSHRITDTTGSIVDDGSTPASNGLITWGHLSSATNHESNWQIVAYHESGEVVWNVDSVAFASRPMSSEPVPVSGLSAQTSGAEIPRLSVAFGPGVRGEEWTIPARSDYPFSALNVALSPSPDETWRSSGRSSAVHLTWDLGAVTLAGKSVAVVLLNHNLLNLYIESFDGTSWDTEYQPGGAVGFTASLTADLSGDVLRPASGTPASGRYLRENELAGGIAYSAADSFASRIRANTAGWWSNNSEAKPEIYLEDPSGFSASFVVTLQPRDLIAFVPSPTNPRARYWRLRLVANLVTPAAEDYYEIGAAMLCRVVPFGRESGWGQGIGIHGTTTISRSRYGTSRVRQQGPNRKSWRLQFSDPADYVEIRSGADLDYYGPSSGGGGSPALIAKEDTAWLLQGIYDLTKAGEIPVVAVAQIPTTDTAVTINDSSLWCYGRMLGPLVLTLPTGTLGADEVIRLDALEIDPIV